MMMIMIIIIARTVVQKLILHYHHHSNTNGLLQRDYCSGRCESIVVVSTDPATRNEIKRIMDAGWDATLGEGMQIEDAANRAHAKAEVRAEKVAARRADIQSRGRDQSG